MLNLKKVIDFAEIYCQLCLNWILATFSALYLQPFPEPQKTIYSEMYQNFDSLYSGGVSFPQTMATAFLGMQGHVHPNAPASPHGQRSCFHF